MSGFMDIAVPMLVIAVLIFSILYRGIQVVSQADIYVVERLGKFNKVLRGGFSLIIPFFDRVVNKVTTKEQLIDVPKQPVITRDNVTINIDGIVFLVVQDAAKATYNVVDFKDAVANLAITNLRSEIGSMALDEVLSSRESLNARILVVLDEAGENWGIKVTRIEISDIQVPHEIEAAMSLQMKAEREKRAIELKASADKEAVIRAAEAQKQTAVLQAEAQERLADAEAYQQERVALAQQTAMERINTAMAGNPQAAEFLLAKDRIKAFAAMAKSNSKDKIVVPYEATDLIGALSIIKDLTSQAKG